MGSPEGYQRLRLFRRGMPRLYVEILFAPIETGLDSYFLSRLRRFVHGRP
jgi:hypothetical protein